MKIFPRLVGLLALLVFLNLSSSRAALFKMPDAPKLNDAGKSLIFLFEGCDLRPDWPGGASGVTIGYGYDSGYYSRDIIEQDWKLLSPGDRNGFSSASGVAGRKAKALATALHYIKIWEGVAQEVFVTRDIPREYDRCKRAFPGFETLSPNAQAALISLGYNRGYAMVGDGRREMRAIRDLCPARDYPGMAAQIRAMKRLWIGTSIERGMIRRRNAEADLLLKP